MKTTIKENMMTSVLRGVAVCSLGPAEYLGRHKTPWRRLKRRKRVGGGERRRREDNVRRGGKRRQEKAEVGGKKRR